MGAGEEKKPAEPKLETKTIRTIMRVFNSGNSVFIQGELRGEEDLTINGRMEGEIELKDHSLLIGPDGKIKAEITAKNVTVAGSVIGNINASELVEIKSTGSVVGDLKCSRILIVDAAKFKGSIDTQTRADTTTRLDSPKAESAKMSHGSSLGKFFSKS
jgi:cytoskeletal protein CcmA (bactofilin family)